MRRQRALWGTVAVLLAALATPVCRAQQAAESRPQPPENVYRGELVRFPGPWAFLIGRSSIILVSDQELEALADPDRLRAMGQASYRLAREKFNLDAMVEVFVRAVTEIGVGG